SNIIQEYVKYFYDQNQGYNTASLTILPERIAPDAASYDAALNPVAHVYTLGDVPDNFLARTRNPLSIPRGQYVGDFAWNGAFIDWGAGGPLGLTDQFLIEQARSFLVPSAGVYTFKVSSDDGAWLWIDGQLVVDNSGLHSTGDVTGTASLSAGAHVVGFKYFERSGSAAAGYSVQMPGTSEFVALPDGLGGGAESVGSIFAANPHL